MNKDRALRLLKDHYFKEESPIAFANKDYLYEFFKDWLNREDIERFLMSVPEYTKHRKFVNKFNRNYIYAMRKRYLLQADLKPLGELAKSNKSNFVLCVIDCFTRKLWCRLLKSKSEKNVTKAFLDILDETGYFNHLCTDRGKEFTNKIFKKLLADRNINHYHPRTLPHAAMAERVIQTLFGLLYKFISHKKSKLVTPYFEKVVETYNSKYHRIIGMSPNEAESGNHNELLHSNLKKYRDNVKRQSAKHSIGDKVRIKIPKNVFSKSYKQSSSDLLFEVIGVNTKHPIPLYKLQNIITQEIVDGQFYSNEIQRVLN